MKFVISVLALLSISSCYSQTKKETEDWLNFYLDKYFSNSKRVLPFNKEMTSWVELYDTGNFFFENGFLLQYKTSYQRFYPRIKTDTLESGSIYKMQIKRIRNITYTINSDSTDFYCNLSIAFYTDNVNPTVVIQKRGSADFKPYQWTDEYEIQTTDKAVIRDSIPQRLIKAFNHLVTLEHGHMINNIF